jgi:hypothetical protein
MHILNSCSTAGETQQGNLINLRALDRYQMVDRAILYSFGFTNGDNFMT